MNTYDRFRSSLLTEFKLKAQPHVRSLWADVVELEEARDEHAFAAALQQALHRVRVLERAAGAANAQAVQTLSETIADMLSALTSVQTAARPGSLDELHRTMNKLTEALYSINAALIESYAD